MKSTSVWPKSLFDRTFSKMSLCKLLSGCKQVADERRDVSSKGSSGYG